MEDKNSHNTTWHRSQQLNFHAVLLFLTHAVKEICGNVGSLVLCMEGDSISLSVNNSSIFVFFYNLPVPVLNCPRSKQ